MSDHLLPALDTERSAVYHADLFTLCAAMPDQSVDMILREECGIIELSPRAANTGDMSQHCLGVLTVNKYITRQCPVCGNSYIADSTRLKHGRQTTCSRRCSYILRAQQKKHTTPLTCRGCGKSFERQPATVRGTHAFCSVECYHAYRAKQAGYKGKLQYRFCLICGAQFKQRDRHHKYCSRQCFEAAHVDNMKGNRNPSYLDGRSYEKTYNAGSDWDVLRREVYKRDSYTCQLCGTKCISKTEAMKRPDHAARIIQCHHIKPYKESRDNSIGNLITVCLKCHRRLHTEMSNHASTAE